MSILPKDCLHSFQSNILGREVQIFQTSEDDVTRELRWIPYHLPFFIAVRELQKKSYYFFHGYFFHGYLPSGKLT